MRMGWGWSGMVSALLLGLVGCGAGVEEQLAPGSVRTQEAAHRSQPWVPPGPALFVRHGGMLDGEYDSEAVAVAHDAAGTVYPLWNAPFEVITDAPPEVPPEERPTVIRRLLTLTPYRADGSSVGWALTLSGSRGTYPNREFTESLGTAIAVAPDGDVLVTGHHTGDTLSIFPVPPGYFLAKVDSATGNMLWVRPLPAPVHGLAVDEAGHIVIAGTLRGTADFGTGRPVSAVANAYVARLSSEGGFQWVHVERKRGEGVSVAVDSRGDIYLAGSTVPNDAPEDASVPLIPQVRKVSSRGKPLWRDPLSGATGAAVSIAVEGDRVVASGHFLGTLDFDGRRIETAVGRGFAVAYTRSGHQRWAGAIGVDAYVALDRAGRAWVTGTYLRGWGDFGFGHGPLEGEPDGIYVARIAADQGRLEGARVVASGGPLEVVDISVSEAGAPALVGHFSGTVDFGVERVPAYSELDYFLLQLAP